MSNRADLSRRSLVKIVGGFGASLVLGSFASISCAATPSEFAAAGEAGDAAKAFAPNGYVALHPDGQITITICKSDMGQGVRTSLAMLAADEMDADWTKVKVVQAGAGVGLVEAQGTGGSSSIRGLSSQMRKMGASTRAMLIAAAAKAWNVDPSTLHTANGKVIGPDGHTAPYEQLIEAAQSEPVPDHPTLKRPDEYTIVGKALTRIDNPDVVTGKAKYGIDSQVDGMVYAVVARPPAYEGSCQSFDDTAARKVEGVLDVRKFNNGVAVFGKHTWACLAGRDALKIQWNPGPHADVDSASIHEKLKSQIGAPFDMPAGAKTVEAVYDLPFLAHATMEPMNALADFSNDKCRVWAPTQVPDSVRGDVAGGVGIPQDSVEVHVTLLGGGFGRRLFTEYAVEAAQLSKEFGKPVKLTWSREDDMKNDHYRPACHHALKATLDASGQPLGWSHQAVQAEGGPAQSYRRAGIHYDIATAGLKFGGMDCHVPTGPWRSVENTLLNVVNECFMDEVATAAGKDAFEFRRDLIGDTRLKAVLEAAAQHAGWGTPLPAGHGRGIACFSGYGSYVAHVVELSVEGNKIKLRRVVGVVDCGLAVNPKGVEAMIQGGISDGLSTALRAEITVAKGGTVQNSWTDYRWMTMDAIPIVEVYRIENDAGVGGMGEPPYPSVAPAVANAVFAACGKRVRKFPIRVEELV